MLAGKDAVFNTAYAFFLATLMQHHNKPQRPLVLSEDSDSKSDTPALTATATATLHEPSHSAKDSKSPAPAAPSDAVAASASASAAASASVSASASTLEPASAAGAVASVASASASAHPPFEITYNGLRVVDISLCQGRLDTERLDSADGLPLRCVAEIGTLNAHKLNAFLVMHRREPDLASPEMGEVIDFGTTHVLDYFLQTGKFLTPQITREVFPARL